MSAKIILFNDAYLSVSLYVFIDLISTFQKYLFFLNLNTSTLLLCYINLIQCLYSYNGPNGSEFDCYSSIIFF